MRRKSIILGHQNVQTLSETSDTGERIITLKPAVGERLWDTMWSCCWWSPRSWWLMVSQWVWEWYLINTSKMQILTSLHLCYQMSRRSCVKFQGTSIEVWSIARTPKNRSELFWNMCPIQYSPPQMVVWNPLWCSKGIVMQEATY